MFMIYLVQGRLFFLFIVLIFVLFELHVLFFADRNLMSKPVLLQGQLGQIVVVLSFFDQFCPEAALGSIEVEGLVVDV